MAAASPSTGSRVLVVAAPGYGATTLLERLRPGDGVVTPADAVAASGLPPGGWVGIDRLDELAPDARRAVLEEVALAPGRPVALVSRQPLAPHERALLTGIVQERGPGDLALTPFAVATCLTQEHGVHDPETAVEVARVTAGWPALVHLAGDLLAREAASGPAFAGPALVDRLAAPSSAAAAWLVGDVVAGLPEPVRWALTAVVGLGPVTQPLCDAVAAACGRDPASVAGAVDHAARTGLLVAHPATGRLVLVPLLHRVLVDQARSCPDRSGAARMPDGADCAAPDRAAVLRAAARVHDRDGAWLAAAEANRAAGGAVDVAAAIELLDAHGEDMLRAGDAESVVRLVDALVASGGPDHGSSEGREGDHPAYGSGLPERVRLVVADGRRRAGDLGGAGRGLTALVDDSERAGWTAGLVARLAQLHYTRGEFDDALAVLDHPTRAGAPPEDVVDVLACRVHVLAVLGRVDEAVGAADEALRLAERDGGPRLLAAAHLAAARVSRGARAEAHHDAALRAGTAAGDAATTARVLAAQAHLLLAGARYTEACPVARRSVELAEVVSPPGLRAVALHNLGEALARVGELDEARWQLQRSVALCRRIGPARAALGLVGLGDLHRELGRPEQSRAAYDEAVHLARGSGDVQVLVAALCGLARLSVLRPTGHGSGERAGEGAGGWSPHDGDVTSGCPLEDGAGVADVVAALDEAEAMAPAALLPVVLLARGRVELAGTRPLEAAATAARALEAARRVGAADLLAEALELAAATEPDPHEARALLTEARSVWAVGGAVPALARVEVRLGALTCADGAERSRGRAAARVLSALGISQLDGHPIAGAGRSGDDNDGGGGGHGGTVAVDVLGGFTVRVGGREVPLPAWRSRQARTLVKVLVAARGRVVSRGLLCELLWPDDDPARTGHRLSVLLATVRGVLDPGRGWPPDRFVGADQYGVRIDLRHVAVDAEALLLDAAHGAAAMDAGDDEVAREVLAHVDARYRGDAFEEEDSQEWAQALRELSRAAWVRSVRRLATLEARAGHVPEALGLLTRLLAVDPLDEQVHRRLVLSLVRAGRHGEARRAWERWAQAMRAIDAPPPDPALLAERRRPVLTSR